MYAFVFTTLLLLRSVPTRSLAQCGDVTGDGVLSASDALAVLRAAVGQPVDLVCVDSGPSQLRYLNDFSCNQGSDTSEARFNDFVFTADGGLVSEYQDVDRTEIDTIEIDVCGDLFTFPGPIHLPPNRKMTFLMLLLDPAIYEIPGVDIPAQFVIYDDGESASALTIGATDSTPLLRVYGGRKTGTR